MKKIILIVITIMLLVGCSLSNTPSGRVEEYLNNYNNLSEDVLMDIDVKVMSENLSSDNKEVYKKVLKRGYQNMKYDIKDEIIDGDKATVVVKISVYDLYKVEQESINYMNMNVSEFYNENNIFDNDLYNAYRLGEMLKAKDMVDYEVQFELYKKDDQWILENPNIEVIEKLNGFYNYTEN